MSHQPEGPDWYQASDGRWYPRDYESARPAAANPFSAPTPTARPPASPTPSLPAAGPPTPMVPAVPARPAPAPAPSYQLPSAQSSIDSGHRVTAVPIAPSFGPAPVVPKSRLPLFAGIGAVGLVLLGAGLGVLLFRSDPPQAMPPVVGRPADAAQVVLEQRGVDRDRITVEERDDGVRPNGEVLESVPKEGGPIGDRVTLVVARTPTTMPDLQALGTVQAALPEAKRLGITLNQVPYLDPSGTLDDGRIASQVPAAGAPYTPTLEVRVARKPVETFLVDVNPTTGDLTERAATIGGRVFAKAGGTTIAAMRGASTEKDTIEYALDGSYQRFKATIGLSAESAVDDYAVEFRFYLDGATTPMMAAKRTAKEPPVEVDLDVVGKKTLKVELVAVGSSLRSGEVYPVLGDARFIGLPPPITVP